MEKNQIYKGEITGYSAEGFGICRIENMVCFVKGSVRKDVCLIRIVKVLKNVCYGIIEELLVPSPSRTASLCPHFPKCGGCDFHHMTYDEELWFKKEKVESALKRIAGIDYEVPMAGSKQVSHYRNKAQYPVAVKNDKVTTGFYRARSHDVIPMENCLLQKEKSNEIAHFVCDFWQKNGLSVYDEIAHKGVLRHIYIRTGKDEMQLVLVVTQKEVKKLKAFIAEVTSEFPMLSSIVLNIHPDKTNAVLGKTNITVYGKDTLTGEMCGNIFEISPSAFFQINKEQAETIYDQALEYAQLDGTQTVLDLYCGIGTITLHLAKKAKKIYGIEIVPEAIENAKLNAQRNGIENAEFFCADAGKGANMLIKKGVKLDVICVDPPRKGMDENTINAILTLAPEKVVYVSCDCSTMARDVKILSENGYKLKKASAFDMFPRTSHVESCVMLERE
ncbi:MAG: 23S rRNA (uracil(1939)-C(5))-methyltransferase RlmD [Clostridia bacterium]|nr:23S rRNA (uracil(1939)-C(5))-methyltransferase RlmD [Clostridia bacterium]